MSKQPKALLLANILEHQIPSIDCLDIAATELRRLHEVNQELVEALLQIRHEIRNIGSNRSDGRTCQSGRKDMNDRQRLEAIVDVVVRYLVPDGIMAQEAMSDIIRLIDLLPETEKQSDVTFIDEGNKQEPVAWMYDWYDGSENEDGEPTGGLVSNWITTDYYEAHSPTMGCHNIRPLYTSPHSATHSADSAETFDKREWVWLTDDDRIEIAESMDGGIKGFLMGWGWLNYAKALEAKCMEKNI